MLKIKVNEQMSIFQANGIEHKFLSHNILLKSNLHELNDFDQKDLDFAKKNGLPIDGQLDNLVVKINEFNKKFLSNYP
jgi:hypothetical protein